MREEEWLCVCRYARLEGEALVTASPEHLRSRAGLAMLAVELAVLQTRVINFCRLSCSLSLGLTAAAVYAVAVI